MVFATLTDYSIKTKKSGQLNDRIFFMLND